MSDRIDELVAKILPAICHARVDPTTSLGADELDLLLELATIAREAEAMCEWLAGKVSDRDALAATRDGGSFRSPDDWLAAAREAVTRDER